MANQIASASEHLTSTIVAIATPPGRGGIGIVRLSGSQSLPIASRLFLDGQTLQPRVASYRILQDADGRRVDDGLFTYFPAPNSYTGEDVIEIAVHGSPVVLNWLVHACVGQGAAPARAGEFTERAFLGGRIDLTGAEAVRDLIEAQTLAQASMAAEQMGGSIAHTVRPIKHLLVELIAGLEAGIDFAEDDIDTMPAEEMLAQLAAIKAPLKVLLNTFEHGRILRQGLRLAIVGEPNVGKSSLFNRLVEHERAIVTATPGTTRDVIAEQISLDGIPVELLDTAGLRETDDEAERIGVSRSRQAMAEADAVLVVVDASASGAEQTQADGAYASLAGRPVILVRNKSDLQTFVVASDTAPGLTLPREDGLTAASADRPPPEPYQVSTSPVDQARHLPPDQTPLPNALWPVVHTSALTGYGIEDLKAALLTIARGGTHGGTATLTNLRQREAVSQAVEAMDHAGAAVLLSVPHEMVLLNLYESLRALDGLTGETTPDDILHLIFSTFCIGK